MNRQLRLAKLLDLILETGFVTIDKIQEEMGISAATARRDLDVLASQQLVARTRGGAMVNSSSGEVPLGFKTSRQGKQKAAIAQFAAGLVNPGDVIAFNGGTTTTATAYEVGVRSAAQSGYESNPVTVVTNAVNIANDLTIRPNVRVVVVGGVARSRSYELIGPLADAVLAQINIDTLFLGVDAIDPVRGCFTHDDSEAATNAKLVRAARRVILIADSTKVGAHAFAHICGLDQVDMLVTDSGGDAELMAQVAQAVTVERVN